jgi:hypothetical protein
MDRQSMRAIELLLGITCIGVFGLWLIYAVESPSLSLGSLFLHPNFYIFLGSLVSLIILQMYQWKKSINNAERAIYEIIVYRKMTPINALANKLQISKDSVFEIIQKMILEYKIVGHIENGIYYTNSPRTPVCPICKEDISTSLRLITCPICRKPFHKDHLMAYLEDVEEKCPNCVNTLTLGDLFLE